MSAAALEVRELCAGWGRAAAVRDVSFALRPGERAGLLGPNGAGKTTLFDAISGRLATRRGRVSLDGRDVTGQRPHRLARAGLGYVPQTPSVFVDLTVRDNLVAAASAPAARRPRTDADVRRALEEWGLDEVAERAAGVLSGGERRRLEVARTLLLAPSVLLLDEPFAGLDPEGRAALRRGLDRLPRGTALLLTDHAAHDVVGCVDRVLSLVDGGLVGDVPTAEFAVDHPAYSRYFGA